jgi:hypothetical protein
VTALITAALKWDPTIRGILFPAIQFLVLCGGSYLLLATNMGNRLGFLLANAAFWGWMAMMCIVWLIYGIGLLGKSPSWKGQEAISTLSEAQFSRMRDLAKIPGAIPDIPAPGAEEVAVKADAPVKKLGQWREVREGTPTRGEASASVDSFVKRKLADGGAGLFPEKGVPLYKSVAAYDTGGEQIAKFRPRLESGGDWYNPADYRFMGLWHAPRHYVEVLRPYKLDSSNSPVLANGKPVIDPDAKPIFVHAIRDLGNKRRPAWLLLGASTIMLFISGFALHKRDKQLMAHMSLAKAA